jgi:uncharacterized protein (TIRG00374 family)
MQLKLKKIFQYAVLFIIVIGILLALSNFQKFRQNFREINPLYAFFAMTCAIFVHFLEGLFLRSALYMFKENLPFFSALQSALVINSIGYFVSLGGLTPFATQIHILDGYGIDMKKATVSRILHVFLFNTVFDCLLIYGFIAIMFGNSLHGPYTATVLGITIFFMIIHHFLYVALFWVKFRQTATGGIFRMLNRVIRLFSKNFSLDAKPILSFFDDFQDGVHGLVEKPGWMFLLILITLGVYLFWVGAMYFTFLSLKHTIPFGILAVGFAIAQIVGVLSMVPGGLGALEGSGALAYAALGVPIETALSTMLTFRLIYYIFPFVLSLPLYFARKYPRGRS